jgi:hypothetical protein
MLSMQNSYEPDGLLMKKLIVVDSPGETIFVELTISIMHRSENSKAAFLIWITRYNCKLQNINITVKSLINSMSGKSYTSFTGKSPLALSRNPPG